MYISLINLPEKGLSAQQNLVLFQHPLDSAKMILCSPFCMHQRTIVWTRNYPVISCSQFTIPIMPNTKSLIEIECLCLENFGTKPLYFEFGSTAPSVGGNWTGWIKYKRVIMSQDNKQLNTQLNPNLFRSK